MPILRIRDENGKFIPINAIKGDNGKSAYEQAQEGGYKGTLEDFIAILNGLTNTEDANHYADYNNPHQVTTKQIGAIPEAYYVSTDLNIELGQGGEKMTVCCYNNLTLNTPYKENATPYAHGMVITNSYDALYGTQMCLPSGENAVYVRRVDGNGISEWLRLADDNQIRTLQAEIALVSQELSGTITPRVETLESQKVRIAAGSYKGTNTYGTKNPSTLTFDFVPKMVVVAKRGSANATNGSTFIWIAPSTTLNFINNGSTYWCYTSLSGTTLSWYSTESSAYQLNNSNYEYDYLAWG